MEAPSHVPSSPMCSTTAKSFSAITMPTAAPPRRSKKKKKKNGRVRLLGARRRTGRDRHHNGGHAEKVAERRKHQKYGPACNQLGLGFIPWPSIDGHLGKTCKLSFRVTMRWLSECRSLAPPGQRLPSRHTGTRGSLYALGEAR